MSSSSGEVAACTAFRNVDVSPRDPVEQWPQEAIQTALERGGLSDWRRLAAAIRSEPWGSVTRRVEEVLTYSQPYGLTRAEFASRIGTSPSRLSTYATGKVTPSATLLIRMRSVAERRNP